MRLKLLRFGEGYTQEYYARAADSWRLVCVSERDTLQLTPTSSIRDLAIGRERDSDLLPQLADVQVIRAKPTSVTIRLAAQIDHHQLALYITLETAQPYFHCVIEDQIGAQSLVEHITSSLIFTPGQHFVGSDELDVLWVPHQRPLPEHVIADHTFRSPAVILQKDRDLALLVPDVALLGRNRVMKTAIDFDVHGRLAPTPTFGYGFKDWVTDRHVYFSHLLGEGVPIPEDGGFKNSTARAYLLENQSLRYGYYLYISADAEPLTGRRVALDFLWKQFARPYMDSQWPQTIPFEDYIRYMFGWSEKHQDTVWQRLTLNGQEVGAALRVITTKGERINWPVYHGWFKGWHGMFLRNTIWDSNVRSAMAYRYYGNKWNNPSLVEKSNLATRFSLAAPQNEGIFPTVFVPGEQSRWNSFSQFDYQAGHWELSDARRPENHDSCYHVADSSYTAVWLLKWYRQFEANPEIVAFCKRYADFLVDHQLPSGAFPAWIRTGTLEPSEIMKESAETSTSMHVLADMYRLNGDQRYLDAAIKAGEFLLREVLPFGKWEDFETYFSCATLWDGKQIGQRDPHTGVYPANTLCIQWGAEAFYSLYQTTGDRRFLDAGIDALDQLCLYQQVWNCSFLTVPTFGGFCSQNTDAEWSDLRTGLFALTLLDYYAVTGNAEYFERAVAAQRSCFALLYVPENTITYNYLRHKASKLTVDEHGTMWENMAHGGDDLYWEGSWVNFHWFLAPAVAAGIIEQQYGGVYANQQYGQVFGVDGCAVLHVESGASSIRFTVKESLNRRRAVPVVVNTDGQQPSVIVDQTALAETSISRTPGKLRFLLDLEPNETRDITIGARS
ncbi:MAG: hypothetical protein JNM70_02910 [Anaerolineae bacterium]|nr:hypothetical protein [Anaerolineae bacterium]